MVVSADEGDEVLRALFERATNSSKQYRGANSIPPLIDKDLTIVLSQTQSKFLLRSSYGG